MNGHHCDGSKLVQGMEEEEFEKFDVDEGMKTMFREPMDKKNFVDYENMDLQSETDLRIWLRALLEDKRLEHYKDVTFIVGPEEDERRVSAHRLILNTRSRTFADILGGEADINGPVRISGVDGGVFDSIIHYVYTGQVDTPKRVLQTVDLMQAAKKYDIIPLYNLIKIFLLRRLPKLRIKHFIMITQRVLDLNLTELEPECLLTLGRKTDLVLLDPFFLRVSNKFIAKVLELNEFNGIDEAEVFERILEWANLRKGSCENTRSSPVSDKEDSEFGLQRPEVRAVLESFIRSFRLTSVGKDHLASLVKNSGVFTEHEQLVVSYYLLDQTKDLGEFSMKSRGKKPSLKQRVDDHGPTETVNVQALKPAQETDVHSHGHDSLHMKEHIHQQFPVMLSSFTESKPKREASTDRKPAKVEFVANVDTDIQTFREEAPDSPNLVDKFKSKFPVFDKQKKVPRESKTKKDDKKKAKENTKALEVLSVPVDVHNHEKHDSTSSSSSSASNSPKIIGSSSPKTFVRVAAPLGTETKDDINIAVSKRAKPAVPADRPKSVLVDGDAQQQQPREWGSVGKRNAIKNGFSGLMSKTKKWSPEHPRPNSSEAPQRPQVPPRVKSTGSIPTAIETELVAEI